MASTDATLDIVQYVRTTPGLVVDLTPQLFFSDMDNLIANHDYSARAAARLCVDRVIEEMQCDKSKVY